MAAQRGSQHEVGEAVEIAVEEGSDAEEDVFLEIGTDVDDPFHDDDSGDFPLANDEISESEDESEAVMLAQARSTSPSAAASTSSAISEPSRADPPYVMPGPSGMHSSAVHTATPSDVHSRPSVMEYESDEEDDDFMHNWSCNLHNFPLVSPFVETQTGLQVDMAEDAEPVDFYKLFITPDIIRLMRVETNRYATSIIQGKRASGCVLSPRSMYNTWTQVTNDEIISFLAILIHMGVVHKPRLVDYWSKNPALATSFAPLLMECDRFRAVLAFFHLNDNRLFVPKGQRTHDPLHKVRPLVEHLRQTFQTTYKPGQNVCIDEALCPWRGRVAFRVYMRDKPTRWGMKLYELCESSTGYVWDFEVYCHMPNLSNTPYDVCHRLMEPLMNKGHVLFINNYYCNPALAFSMSAEDTGVVGTVRANRKGMPADLATQPMQRGQVDYRRQNQVLALRWKDKRNVYLLTTKHLPEMRETSSRVERKEKPIAVMDYTHNMAGVDKSDQMIAYMPLHRKTLKWWKKLTFHLLTLTMVQAHCLFNVHRQSKHRRTVDLETFVLAVCNSLAVQARPAAVPVGPSASTSASINSLTDRHFLEPIPTLPGQSRVQKACIVCYAKLTRSGASMKEKRNKRKKTQTQCAQCLKPLCMHPCFIIYHTQEHYDR